MKKIYWLGILMISSVFCFSCLNDERVDNVYYSVTPIDSVQIGAVNRVGELTEIKTFYTRRNSCEDFFDYDYFAFDTERRVTIVTVTVKNDQCEVVQEADAWVLKFIPQHSGEYHFKFWNGNDENNKPIYLEEIINIQ